MTRPPGTSDGPRSQAEGVKGRPPGSPVAMEQGALRAAYTRYEAAQAADRETRTAARLALCLALMHTGWAAPAAVREQMQRDQKTLRRLRDIDTIDLTGVLDLTRQPPSAVRAQV